MRRFLCLAFAVFFGGVFAACSMPGDGIEFLDEQPPYKAEIYMQVPADWISADNWAQFEQTVANDIEVTNASREGYYTNATATVDLADPFKDGDTAVFIIHIKIDGVKQRTADTKSDLWYRYQTVRMFNPLNVLKPVYGVVYNFGAAWEIRMTTVPNAVSVRGEDGSYQYIWYANSPTLQWDWQNEDITVYMKDANAPMWYTVAVLTAALAGVIVYFACKKPRNKDIIQ
jgi:hypothetical protein